MDIARTFQPGAKVRLGKVPVASLIVPLLGGGKWSTGH